MSACRPIDAWLAARRSEEIPSALVPDALAHLDGCAACRARVAAADPLAMFALLARERTEPALWSGFDARLRAAIQSPERATDGARGRAEDRAPAASPLWSLAGWRDLFRPRQLALAGGAAAIAVFALVALRAPFENGQRTGGAAGVRTGLSGLDREGATTLVSGIEWVSGVARAVGEDPGAVSGDSAALSPDIDRSAGVRAWMAEHVTARNDRNDRTGGATPAPVETVVSPSARVISLAIDQSALPSTAGARGAAAGDSGQTLSAGSDVVLIVDQEIDI